MRSSLIFIFIAVAFCSAISNLKFDLPEPKSLKNPIKLWATSYYVPSYSSGVPSKISACRMEGTCIIGGKCYNAADSSASKFESCKGLYGTGYRMKPLVPYRSIAVARRGEVPLGSVIYIPDARNVAITLPDGRKVIHDGYFYASDTGGRIKGNHIDVFIGLTNPKKTPFKFVKSNAKGTFTAYRVYDKNIISQIEQTVNSFKK